MLPGDVLRRSPKRPAEVFESLIRFLKDQPSDHQKGGEMTILSLCLPEEEIQKENNSFSVEVDVMFEFVVFRAFVKVFEDEAATFVSFRDMLGQDQGTALCLALFFSFFACALLMCF